MATLTPEETVLILRAFVADCQMCGGVGRRRTNKNKKVVTRAGQELRIPKLKWAMCGGCKYQLRLAQQLERGMEAERIRARISMDRSCLRVDAST